MAPEQLAAASAAAALHHPLVGIPAARVQARDDARAGALELVVGRVQHLERAADQLLAGGAEHVEQLLVAVDDQAVARDPDPQTLQPAADA